MKILVACEFSGRVRDEFSAKGHEAMSCDILPTEAPGPHYQGDVRDLLEEGWDMMIAFPPCTHLSKAGARYWKEKQADGRMDRALDLVRVLMDAPVDRIAVENPIGYISTAIRKPDQIVQPYQFGDPWRKATCLWLKGLALLSPTNPVEPKGSWVGGDAKWVTGQHRSPRVRSITFPGIARAMAEQWG